MTVEYYGEITCYECGEVKSVYKIETSGGDRIYLCTKCLMKLLKAIIERE